MKICEFCNKKAVISGAKFAGDHGEATGPFTLCYGCLKFHVNNNGMPMGNYIAEDLRLCNKAVWG